MEMVDIVNTGWYQCRIQQTSGEARMLGNRFSADFREYLVALPPIYPLYPLIPLKLIIPLKPLNTTHTP